MAAQYYHKSADYNNDFNSELAVPATVGSERNQRLLNQTLDTDDVNFRVTWRPTLPGHLGTISFVTRYDYLSALITGRWAVSPTQTGIFPNPPTPPSGTLLQSEHTGLIFNQIFTESITWNPTARLYLQANVSYVLSKTNTPADYILIPNTEVTILDFKNDYWTASAAAGYALDEKTDLRAEVSYYRANDYVNNALAAVPYGMSATEYTVGASISREIRKNIRLKLQYGYFHYTDQTSGDHNNYEAHSVFSSLQFRF